MKSDPILSHIVAVGKRVAANQYCREMSFRVTSVKLFRIRQF